MKRTGTSNKAVVGWGRGMGHRGHMYLASSVITHAKENNADAYFILSNTIGKDDPIYPDEKLSVYKKVFPKYAKIFQTENNIMLALTDLSKLKYDIVTVVVGADQVESFQYLVKYNNTPDKKGNILYAFKKLSVISRQQTNDPSRTEEGPRATPMRNILKDRNATEEEQFRVWRDAMSQELSDEEVKSLMNKAKSRMKIKESVEDKPIKPFSQVKQYPLTALLTGYGDGSELKKSPEYRRSKQVNAYRKEADRRFKSGYDDNHIEGDWEEVMESIYKIIFEQIQLVTKKNM